VVGQHAGTVRLLLERGANIESRDSAGSTPLRIAVLLNREDIVQQLLEAGADFRIRDNEGQDLLKTS
jgi:uncharacterized protein